MELLQIARIAHEANRAYSDLLEEGRTLKSWGSAGAELQASVLEGVRAVDSALRRGAEITPALLHESWLEFKRSHGWAYGPQLDEGAKLHPNMRAFSELPIEQQTKDKLFLAICVTLLTLDR